MIKFLSFKNYPSVFSQNVSDTISTCVAACVYSTFKLLLLLHMLIIP